MINLSKEEQYIKTILINKFGKDNIITQYKSKEYPFNCDFYIKSIDTYIEYQGSWTHGGKPFVNNKECQKQLQKWSQKLNKYYNNAIKIWTQKDPLKRKIAKNNNLKWFEFFTVNSFINWLNSLD